MKIGYRQKLCFPCQNPAFLGKRLAFGAMPVAAGVVGDFLVAAFITDIHMPAEFRCPAVPNRFRGFPDMGWRILRLQIFAAILPENILHLKHWLYRIYLLASCRAFSARNQSGFSVPALPNRQAGCTMRLCQSAHAPTAF